MASINILVSEITAEVKLIIADILNNRLEPIDIDNDTPLFLNGIGLDSIDLLQLIPRIEKQFDIKIGVSNYNALKTVNYLVQYILDEIVKKEECDVVYE